MLHSLFYYDLEYLVNINILGNFIPSRIWNSCIFLNYICYNLQDLKVGQEKEPCIGFTQENSIENSVQDCLPYILKLHGPCQLLLAYPKQLCVCFKIDMC